MTNIYRFLALCLLLGASLVGGQAAARASGLEVNRAGDISYVSGGVGASEQEALALVKQDYNLRLLFAVSGSGSFLASVPVTIADARGQILVDAISAGPYFYAQVPAGRYQVTAERRGRIKTQSVGVPAAGAVSVDFRWDQD